MSDALDVLSNPYALTAIIVLSLFSFIFCYSGVKGKNAFHLLLGIATGIPTYSIANWRFWAAGGVVVVIAFWVRNFIDSPN